MIYTQHFCAKCGSGYVRRNGSKNGQPKYQCTACRYQGLFVPAAVRKAAQYAHVDVLLSERNSQRSIARLTGVARVTIAKRIKKAAAPSPPRPPRRSANAQRKRWEVLELDELWSFVGHKKRKVWLWLVIERARRRIVGWTLGNRGEAPLRRFWQSLPVHYRRHCWLFTDQWNAYTKVLPCWQHRPFPKGEGQTSIVEAINCSLHQRCDVLVRKYCCSANPWPCTRPALKLSSIITTSPCSRPPPVLSSCWISW